MEACGHPEVLQGLFHTKWIYAPQIFRTFCAPGKFKAVMPGSQMACPGMHSPPTQLQVDSKLL